MFTPYVDQLKLLLHQSAIGQIRWLDWLAAQLIDFLTSPLTGLRTRSYWPELVAGILIAALVFALRDRLPSQGPRAFLAWLFPKRMFIHNSTWVDCKLILANNFVTPAINLTWRLNTVFFTTGLLAVLTAAFGSAPHWLTWTTPTLILFTILFGLAEDFGYYVFHVAAHRIPVLWAFHKVHHSAETLQVFANVRVHPVEVILTGPFKAAATALVMAPALYLGVGEVSPVTLLGMNLMAAFYGAVGSQLHHSHIWISWGRVLEHVFISPAQHQIHHSSAPHHWNRNMGGNFALWDWMFGTLYVPRGRETISFGLLNGAPQPHPTLRVAYLEPFREAVPQALRERVSLVVRKITSPPLARGG